MEGRAGERETGREGERESSRCLAVLLSLWLACRKGGRQTSQLCWASAAQTASTKPGAQPPPFDPRSLLLQHLPLLITADRPPHCPLLPAATLVRSLNGRCCTAAGLLPLAGCRPASSASEGARRARVWRPASGQPGGLRSGVGQLPRPAAPSLPPPLSPSQHLSDTHPPTHTPLPSHRSLLRSPRSTRARPTLQSASQPQPRPADQPHLARLQLPPPTATPLLLSPSSMASNHHQHGPLSGQRIRSASPFLPPSPCSLQPEPGGVRREGGRARTRARVPAQPARTPKGISVPLPAAPGPKGASLLSPEYTISPPSLLARR